MMKHHFTVTHHLQWQGKIGSGGQATFMDEKEK